MRGDSVGNPSDICCGKQRATNGANSDLRVRFEGEFKLFCLESGLGCRDLERFGDALPVDFTVRTVDIPDPEQVAIVIRSRLHGTSRK